MGTDESVLALHNEFRDKIDPSERDIELRFEETPYKPYKAYPNLLYLRDRPARTKRWKWCLVGPVVVLIVRLVSIVTQDACGNKRFIEMAKANGEKLKYLLEKADQEHRESQEMLDDYSWTPLKDACVNDSKRLIEMVKANGKMLNYMLETAGQENQKSQEMLDDYSWTPLEDACVNDNKRLIEMVKANGENMKFLLEKADQEHRKSQEMVDDYSWIPLKNACESDNKRFIEMVKVNGKKLKHLLEKADQVHRESQETLDDDPRIPLTDASENGTGSAWSLLFGAPAGAWRAVHLPDLLRLPF